jgi:tripartite-type tricarboxylate transporter receptor subunit TctC
MKRFVTGLVLAGALVATIAAGLTATAHAQAYPQKPVRVVLPFLAGTGPDLVARSLTEKMAQSTGQQFVIENRGGANGIIALEAVAKSPPDGYTIVFADIGQLAINRSLYKKLPYDPEADFAPIGVAYSTPFYVLTSGKGPYKTLAELLAAAKNKPGSVNFASSGSGSPTQLFMEQLKTAAGVEMAHIPFKGSPQIVPAILSGDVASVMLGMGSVRGLVEQGQLRALAVTGATRTAGFPDIPTVAEAAGLKEFSAVTWVAFAAPAKTPRDIIDRLNAEMRKALAQADVRARMASQGFDAVGGTPEQLTQRIREDSATYAAIIKATGAQVD